MAKWQPHQGWRAVLYTRWAIFLIAIFGLLIGRAVWQNFWRQRLVITDRTQLEQDLVALANRESKLEEEINLLKSERGLEEKIREKFLVVQEGERVVAIVATTTGATTTATSSWWRSLWGKKKP